jgi:hypothetical protein
MNEFNSSPRRRLLGDISLFKSRSNHSLLLRSLRFRPSCSSVWGLKMTSAFCNFDRFGALGDGGGGRGSLGRSGGGDVGNSADENRTRTANRGKESPAEEHGVVA